MSKDLGIPETLHESVLSQPFFIAATYWAGDATNSNIWQRQKLQGLLAVSAFLTDLSKLRACAYDEAFIRIKCMQHGANFQALTSVVSNDASLTPPDNREFKQELSNWV